MVESTSRSKYEQTAPELSASVGERQNRYVVTSLMSASGQDSNKRRSSGHHEMGRQLQERRASNEPPQTRVASLIGNTVDESLVTGELAEKHEFGQADSRQPAISDIYTSHSRRSREPEVREPRPDVNMSDRDAPSYHRSSLARTSSGHGSGSDEMANTFASEQPSLATPQPASSTFQHQHAAVQKSTTSTAVCPYPQQSNVSQHAASSVSRKNIIRVNCIVCILCAMQLILCVQSGEWARFHTYWHDRTWWQQQGL
jgi:hypothetical protein